MFFKIRSLFRKLYFSLLSYQKVSGLFLGAIFLFSLKIWNTLTTTLTEGSVIPLQFPTSLLPEEFSYYSPAGPGLQYCNSAFSDWTLQSFSMFYPLAMGIHSLLLQRNLSLLLTFRFILLPLFGQELLIYVQRFVLRMMLLHWNVKANLLSSQEHCPVRAQCVFRNIKNINLASRLQTWFRRYLNQSALRNLFPLSHQRLAHILCQYGIQDDLLWETSLELFWSCRVSNIGDDYSRCHKKADGHTVF